MMFGKPMSMGDALYRKLMKGSPKTEGGSTQKMAKDLWKNSRWSKTKAAEAAGVSGETFRRWLKGDQEAKDPDALLAAQRRARVKPRNSKKFAAGARGAGGDGDGGGGGGGGSASGGMLRIKATVRYSNDERTRWIDVGGDIPHGKLDRVIDLMITEGPEAAGEHLTGLVQEHYFGSSDAEIVDVHDIRW